MSDVDKVGGVPVVLRLLHDARLLHDDAKTVTGESVLDRLRDVTYPSDQDVIHALNNPVRKTGGFAILRGNLAPDGAVLKATGATRSLHHGPAKVFDREEDAFHAIMDQRIVPGTWSSSDTRARRADPGCVRCSVSPRQ